MLVVEQTMEALARAFKEVTWANNWLLMSASGTLLLLNTAGEHYVVAGTEAFVRRVLGCRATTAYHRWCEFVEHFAGQDAYKYYMDVAKYYEEFVRPPGSGTQ